MGRWFLCTVLHLVFSGAVAKHRSAALAEARSCIVNGGRLNLFRPRHGSQHFPRCVRHESCPSGSTEVHHTCVAPAISNEAVEITLTLHAPCSSCQADNGLDLSSKLWLAVAASLQVPLHETKASALLVKKEQWQYNPLQHFTISKVGEQPWGRNPGRLAFSAADVGMAWDLFVAIRIHTSRIDSGDAVLAQLLVSHAGPILEVLGQNSGVQVFEINAKKTDQVNNLHPLEADFKFGDLPWGAKPPPITEFPHYDYGSGSDRMHPGHVPGSPAPPSMPPTLPAAAETLHPTTTMPTTFYSSTARPKPLLTTISRCQCPTTWLRDGVCDRLCYTKACNWDAGDCESSAFASREGAEASRDAVTTSIVWPNGFYQASTSATTLPSYMRNSRTYQSSVVTLEADTDSLGNLHVIASDGSSSWYADGTVEETYAGRFDGSPILLACFIFAICCLLPMICILARRGKRSQTSPGSERGSSLQRDGQQEKRSGDDCSMYSTSTTDSGCDFAQSWNFSGSPTSKETKVHPEPDLENPPEGGCQNNFSDWRMPKMKQAQFNSASAKQQGFRPRQHDWQKPVHPQPSNSWSDSQEEEKRQQRREKEEKLREEDMWCHRKRQEFGSKEKNKRASSEPPRSNAQWPRSERRAHDRVYASQRVGDLPSAEFVPQDGSAKERAESMVENVHKQLHSTRSSSLEDRKKLFRDLQRQFHPDKQMEDQEAAKLVFQRLMEMRDVYLS